MNISRIEQVAFRIVDRWNSSHDVRTDEGQVIIDKETESLIMELCEQVRKKRIALTVQQNGTGRKRGGQLKSLPPREQLVQMLKTHKGFVSRLAKELKVDRKTLKSRLEV